MSAASARRDIADRDDIAALMAEFSRRAFADEVLGPIFVDVARVDLSVHLPVMGDFSTGIAGSIRRRLPGGRAQFVTIEPRRREKGRP